MLMKGNAYGIKLNSGNGIDGVVYVDGDWRVVQSGYIIPEDEWVHVAMTYSSGTRKIKIYINGELKGTNALDGLSSYQINKSTNILTIGTDAMGWGQYFCGYVDEVRVSDTIRYQSMQDAPFCDDKYTMALYHIDECSGSSITDSSSKGNNGTYQVSTMGVNGKFSGTIETNDSRYYTVSDSNSLDITDELTVEVWFKRNISCDYILMKGNAYGIKFNSGNGIDAVVYVDGDWRVVQSGYVVPVNEWTHVAMTYSSNTHELKIYVNGEWKATNTLTGLNSFNVNASTSDLFIGRDAMGWGQYFTGCIDEIRISDIVKNSFPLVN